MNNTLTPTTSTTSQEFKANYKASLKALEEVKRLAELSRTERDPGVLEKHTARGKLLAHQRVTQLIDPGAPFLELSTLAGYNLYDGVPPGAGMISGIGPIAGKLCLIIANDATVKGGTYFPSTVKKHLRAQQIALENKLPCVYLVDSGGAFLPLQDQVFPDREHFGRIFYNQARLSAASIPQIAVVMGSCTAGGAYVPAMSDQTVIVQNQGTIFLGGPPLVKAATGEIVTSEELGGALVHTQKSGVADYLAKNDHEALSITRQIISNLGKTAGQISVPDQSPKPPRYDPSEIYGLIPHETRKTFPMLEVLARLLDDSQLDQFKANYAESIICGFAHIQGYLVGVIANNGILFSESALKACHFIQLCCQRQIPLLFLQDITGFMVGKEYEQQGIAKAGAKLVNAIACAEVPKLTVIVGASFGAGNYGMAGRAYDPRFLFNWPESRVAVMGPQQAATVLSQVRQDSYRSQGKAWSKKQAAKYSAGILKTYNEQSSALYSTARIWDDGIIDPAKTNQVLGLCLGAAVSQEVKESKFGVFRM